VEFDSISRGLLGDIQHLLVRLGIASSVFTKVRAHNSRGSYLSYNLRVVIDDVPLFAERVPVYNNFRSARLALVPPSQSFGTAYRADIVVSVEGDGHGECRCLTVEDDETFLVRDVVVHNSRLVEMVASLACAHYDERVGIACQTNAQTHDLTSRILAAYPHLPVALLARAGLILPDHLEAAPNLVVARAMRQLPQGPCIVLGTAAKWSWSDPDVADLDLLIVDEAWQLADWAFSLIAGMADRFLLVGDPGQIAPVVAADVRRWRSDPSGPHLPCPVTLQARRADDVTVVQLPATRRFGPDTVALVQPSFYPDLPFYSVRPPRGFALVGDPLGCSGELLGRLAGGQELVMGELPASATGMNDPELANIAAELTRNVLSFGRVTSPAGAQALTPADVLVVCAHVSQVGEVQAALGPELAGVRVDTAERCQGQEAELVIVWHPLSGRTDPTEFAKDGGRMCVMASRHRVGCVVLCRAGATDALRRSGASNERVLGVEVDPSYNGWRANLTLLDQLRRHDRVVPVTPLAAQSLAAGTGL
jgi:hypothetical protein